MSCMTHMISFLCGKSHINGREKIGTMMPCTTHVISFLYDKSHINSQKNIGTMMPFFLVAPNLRGSRQDFHQRSAQLCYRQPSLVGSCRHTTRSSQDSKLVSSYFVQSTMEPLLTLWNSSKVKFFQFGSRCFVHLQHGTHRHHKTTIILQPRTMRQTFNFRHKSNSCQNTFLVEPNLRGGFQDFHQRAAQLCYRQPLPVGMCLRTTRSSQNSKLTSWHFRQRTTEPLLALWNSS